MAQITNKDEFIKFLGILPIEIQKLEEAYNNFLTQSQKSIVDFYNYADIDIRTEPSQIIKILHNDDCIDAKPVPEQERESEPAFASSIRFRAY